MSSPAAHGYANELDHMAVAFTRGQVAAAFDAGVAHERSQSKPRTISTAAELDALQKRTVVIGDSGWAWEKRLDNYWYGEGGYVARTSSAIATNYGPFTLLVPASESAPEPVRLTDPDDPRWKDGALVRGEFKDGSAIEGYLETDKRLRFIRYGEIDPGTWYINLDNEVPKVYLLAEAPDDDEPILAALRVGGFVADQLAALRAAGYDVVKRADS